MAIIEEKRKDFIKLYEDYKKVHDKVFLELLKKDNK
jgi:hypothetical protein